MFESMTATLSADVSDCGVALNSLTIIELLSKLTTKEAKDQLSDMSKSPDELIKAVRSCESVLSKKYKIKGIEQAIINFNKLNLK